MTGIRRTLSGCYLSTGARWALCLALLAGLAGAAPAHAQFPFDFTMSNSGGITVAQGGFGATTITATLTSGQTQTVFFSASGLPSGATSNFSSTSCNPTCSTTLTITTSASTPTGTFPITVSGFASPVFRSTSFNLVVNAPFNYSLSNSGGVTVTQGGSGANTITATLTAGTTQSVSFSASGLPSGASASFSLTSCNPTCSTTLTISTAATTPTGTFSITVTGSTSPTAVPVTRTTTFNLVVNAPFSYSLTNSGGISVIAGASGASTITATLTSGATQAVSFSASGLPSGATAGFSVGACNPTCSTVLTITTTAATPAGTFPITVTGSPLGRTTTLNLVVTAPFDYSLSNSGGVTVTAGASGTSTITSTLISGATQAVSFAASGLPSGATATFSVGSCNPTCSTTLTITTTAATATGTFPITVTGSPLGRTTTLNLAVGGPFDYSLSNSGGVTVTAGASGTTTITATLTSGATQAVSFAASGLPSGATAAFSIASCNPTCSTVLTITTTAATAAGTFPITVTGSPLGRTTAFNLVVTVTPLAIAIAAGNNQTGTIGTPLPTPLVVTVTQNGAPVVGVTVTWAVTAGSGVLAVATSVTNAGGQASDVLTPTGPTTTVTASVPGGASVAFTESATGAPLVIAIVAGNNQSGTIGTPLPAFLVVGVTQNGVPVSGVTVTWAVTAGSGALAVATSVTNASGQASNGLTPTGPTTSVTASVPGGASVTFTESASAAQLAIAIVSGNNQAGTIGVPLPASLVVSVTQNGIPVSGQIVTWNVSSGSGTLGAATSVTNASGQASNTLTPAGPTTGVTASVPGASVTFTETATAPAVSITIVSGNNQNGVINSTLPQPLVVRVTPATPSVIVIWEVTGGARPSATSTPTVNGLAQITLTLGPTPGPVTVTASIAGGGAATSVTFVVNDVTSTAITGLKTYSVLGNLALTTTTVQTTNIGIRLAALRRGSTGGVSVSGLSLNVAGQSIPLEALATLMPSSPGGGASADPFKVLGGLGIFLNGQGSFGDQDTSSKETGFKFNTQGLTLGSDYRVSENVVLGAAFGYLHTVANLDDAGGQVRMSGYSLSVFGSYYVADKFYVDTIATYGWNGYGVSRNVTFGDTGATAKADPDANQFSVSVSGGYNFNFGPLTVGPTAKATYINIRIDGFQERGADLFNLRVGGQKVESLATDLGGQISYAISTPWGVLTPLARAEWEHEFKGGSRLISGSLLADPLGTTFGAPTNNPDRNYVNLAAGLTATLPRGMSAFAHYETVLGREHVTNHSFTAGVRFQFE